MQQCIFTFILTHSQSPSVSISLLLSNPLVFPSATICLPVLPLCLPAMCQEMNRCGSSVLYPFLPSFPSQTSLIGDYPVEFKSFCIFEKIFFQFTPKYDHFHMQTCSCPTKINENSTFLCFCCEFRNPKICTIFVSQSNMWRVIHHSSDKSSIWLQNFSHLSFSITIILAFLFVYFS